MPTEKELALAARLLRRVRRTMNAWANNAEGVYNRKTEVRAYRSCAALVTNELKKVTKAQRHSGCRDCTKGVE